MNTQKTRPLSPHLQVYRLPMAALMSITHRVTGAILSGGMLLIAAFLVAAALGEEQYNLVKDFAATPFGIFIITGWAFALYYHTLNGIRHMIWDVKPDTIGMEKATRSGWLIIVGSIVLTAATCYTALQEGF